MRLTEHQVAVVRFSVELLPDREREAIMLRFWRKRTFDAIGRRLEMTAEGARQLIFRALRLLGRSLLAFGFAEPALS